MPTGDGSWSPWLSTGDCSKSCGGGRKEFVRRCSKPSPRYDGLPCDGDDQYGEDCNTQICPSIKAYLVLLMAIGMKWEMA